MARGAGLLVLALAAAAPAGRLMAAPVIQAWVRAPGAYGADMDPPHKAVRDIDLGRLQQQQVRKADVQYGGTYSYRGVPLRTIIAAYRPPPAVDLLLLHCRNGMIIPVPFRDERAMGRMDLLVALSMRGPAGEQYGAGQFSPIDKRVEGYADIRQVTFTGNKLVVSDRWHPDVPEGALAQFTPWTSTDSLTGIEFVQRDAYYRQFEPGEDTSKGAALFRQSCQFCHGVRRVGASFGWDFARPIEAYTYKRDPQRLYYHIRYRAEAQQRGELMPALKHVSEEDAGHLWRWLKAVATHPIPTYAAAF